TGINLTVTGNVTSTARISAMNIDNLSIGGSFAGVLNTGNLNDNGTLITGSVLASGRINSQNTLGNRGMQFGVAGTSFLGALNIGHDLTQNLTFGGNVNRVTIGGLVKGAAQINVGGTLSFLSSGSLFSVTTPLLAGNFVDGAGVITGTLA